MKNVDIKVIIARKALETFQTHFNANKVKLSGQYSEKQVKLVAVAMALSIRQEKQGNLLTPGDMVGKLKTGFLPMIDFLVDYT